MYQTMFVQRTPEHKIQVQVDTTEDNYLKVLDVKPVVGQFPEWEDLKDRLFPDSYSVKQTFISRLRETVENELSVPLMNTFKTTPNVYQEWSLILLHVLQKIPTKAIKGLTEHIEVLPTGELRMYIPEVPEAQLIVDKNHWTRIGA